MGVYLCGGGGGVVLGVIFTFMGIHKQKNNANG